ncbi:hypothetical protein Acsp04_61070 [Actinomadura sp. NBRC 104425]|nr:hypothetical protein Acsp04_61070 [Actinomadura sp. NBRC 104425]
MQDAGPSVSQRLRAFHLPVPLRLHPYRSRHLGYVLHNGYEGRCFWPLGSSDSCRIEADQRRPKRQGHPGDPGQLRVGRGRLDRLPGVLPRRRRGLPRRPAPSATAPATANLANRVTAGTPHEQMIKGLIADRHDSHMVFTW